MHFTLPLRFAGALLALAVAMPGQAQEADLVGSPEGPVVLGTGVSAPLPVLNQFGALIYDNGPIVTSVGTGPAAEDESILQNTSLGMSINGYNQNSATFRLADDFVVPAGETWNVNEMVFFGYQTGSTTTSTFTSVVVQIRDGDPRDAGSTVVFGDTVTNRMTSTEFSNIIRRAESLPGNVTRPVMMNTAAVSTSLTSGTYWVEVGAMGTLASGPWMPPITIVGELVTGNALHWVGTEWVVLDDTSTVSGGNHAQGIPFQVYGTVVVANEGGPAIAGEFALGAPTPNPSVSMATLAVQVGRAQDISVVVYDVVGRAVATLHEGPAAVGRLSLSLDSSTLPSGAYLVRAAGEAGAVSQRLIITR